MSKDPFEPPIPLFGEMKEETPIPIDALGHLREPVLALEVLTKAPRSLCMQCVLAAEALVYQGFADVETLGGRSPISIFQVTVAASGERKSQCDALASRAIEEFERRELAEYSRKLRLYEQQKRRSRGLGDLIDEG